MPTAIATSMPDTAVVHTVKTMPSSSKRSAQGHGLDHRAMLSEVSLSRPDSAIRSLFPAEHIPGMLSLLAGKPNSDKFPISKIALTIKHIAQEEETTLSISEQDLDNGLQYGQTWGLARLVECLIQWQSRLYGRTIVRSEMDNKQDGKNPWKLSIGGGSQDLLTKTFSAIVNPGDSVLAESPVYTGILPILTTLKVNVVGVETDSEGLMSSALEATLANWFTSPKTASHPFPKLIYTVPTAANPSGTTASEQRKRQVLAIARKYGIIIMEDDP